MLDDAEQRLAYYRTVLADAERHWADSATRAAWRELCRESCP
jgi:hypothetical protein